ncbi:MAG: diaminopimelate epimerase [Gammaproteobacteria bacterium]|nr:diaminopimelate epimerase [Gammaproteobacteria bacterium]
MSSFEQSLVFTKMHVYGNDFCLINGLSGKHSLEPGEIRSLGDRRTGVGFDQLILIERAPDSGSDIALQFFNSDGTKTGQCGNGCVAVAAFLHKHQLVRESPIRLAISDQITECTITEFNSRDEYTVEVNLGPPILHPDGVPFCANEQKVQYELNVPSQPKPVLVSVLSLGNPHAVVVVPNLEHLPIDTIAFEIQQDESFPNGTNVQLLEIQDESNGKLRIFERGVGETRASGTGAAAATVAGILQNLFTDSVRILMPGGAALVRWKGQESPVIVRCKPSFSFTGTIPFSSFS